MPLIFMLPSQIFHNSLLNTYRLWQICSVVVWVIHTRL